MAEQPRKFWQTAAFWIDWARRLHFFWLLWTLFVGTSVRAILHAFTQIPEVWITPIWLFISIVVLWIISKVWPRLFGKQPPPKLTKVNVHREDGGEGLNYRWKVRISIKNDADKPIYVRSPVWIANGDVSLELPPKLMMQIERFHDGDRTNQWSDEIYELSVPAGYTFRTWIGLHENLSNTHFGRLQTNQRFGTLLLTADGNDVQIPV
jgi:hypothetical protein